MVFSSLSATVLGQGSTVAIDTSGSTFLWIALIAGLLGLVFALFLARSVLAYDTGTPEMRLISNAIREGAEAFMSRQYTTIAALAVVLAIALFVGYKFSDFTAPLAGKVVISFLLGVGRLHGDVRLHPDQHPRRQRRPFQPGPRPEDCPPRRRRYRPGGHQP